MPEELPTPNTPAVLTAPALQVAPLSGRKFGIKWTQGEASGIEIFVDYGDDYPAQGQILTDPEGEITVEGVEGDAPVSAKVKGIYLRDGERVGAFGPTRSTMLLP